MPAQRVGRDAIEALLDVGRQRERSDLPAGSSARDAGYWTAATTRMTPSRIVLRIRNGPLRIGCGRIVDDGPYQLIRHAPQWGRRDRLCLPSLRARRPVAAMGRVARGRAMCSPGCRPLRMISAASRNGPNVFELLAPRLERLLVFPRDVDAALPLGECQRQRLFAVDVFPDFIASMAGIACQCSGVAMHTASMSLRAMSSR